VGLPNLRELAGLFRDLDFDYIMTRNNVEFVTGFAARNQLYYNIMTQPGVKDPKRNYTKAPEYIRSAAASAFTYGERDTPEDKISSRYIDAYNASKGLYSDADLQAIMDILLAHP
jgi:hypothetical protein